MKKDNFYKDSFLLTVSNLITGIFGFIFSIILSRKLGPEGIGLYGLVMPIYNLFICLISGGMVTAISRVSAIYYAKNDYNSLNKTIKVSMTFDLIWSLLVTTFVFVNAKYLSYNIIKDVRTINSLMIICPAMIFIALSSILKGYFYGTSQIKEPAYIDILEKASRIIIIVLALKVFNITTIKNRLSISYVALTIGEFISFLLLYIIYSKQQRSYSTPCNNTEDGTQLLFDVLKISFPLCINGFLSTILSTASTLLMPRRLVACGIEYGVALGMIGKFSGMALTIVFFPIIVINSISLILIPDISQSLIRKNYYAINKRILEVVKLSLLLGISTFVICISIPQSLGVMFFKRTDLGNYIKFAAICAPISYIASTTFGILNGLGKQKIILRNSLIVSFEELFLIYFLVGMPSLNIYGYGISIIITGITFLVLNFHEINKNFNLLFNFYDFATLSLIGILIFFVLNILNLVIPNTLFILKNIMLITIGFVLFIICSLIFKKADEA